MAKEGRVLVRRTIRIDQNPRHPVYLFALKGEELLDVADISRVSRDDANRLIGYQRPAVKRHIQEIVEYLNGEEVLFPNAIILSLSPDVRFRSSRGPGAFDGVATAGVLEIPLPRPGGPKPAWIVDGQQRVLALSGSKRRHLPVPVAGFVAAEVSLQRDQFLRINNAKPLPRGLITELLPEVDSPLPPRLAARKVPSAVCDWLNEAEDSPFRGLIRRSSTPKERRKRAVVTDTSVVRMVEESLSSPSGCLFPYRNLATGETDFSAVLGILSAYWSAVRDVFPDAWGKPPTQSRLMHGAGIRAMGRLMDKVMSVVRPGPDMKARAEEELRRIAPWCRWTGGEWEELGGMAWNELQNVPRHISVLSNYLIRKYLEARGGAA